MIYKFPQGLITQIQGELKTLLCEDGYIFVEAKKKLYDFFEKTSLPQSFVFKQATELESAKAAKCEELNKKCDELLLSFESEALGEVYVYDSELEDQLNLLGIVSANIDSFFRCRKKDESIKQNLPHSKEQLKQVYADGLSFKSKMIYRCGELKALVQNAKSLDEVASIVWSE